MLELTKGTASENIIVTLTEKVTLSNPYYLFIFTHILQKTTVSKIFSSASDTSGYTDRYNKFALATVTVFNNQPVGQYNYRVYEQASSTNTDPDNATLIESGKMILYPATAFSEDEYNESQTFKAYNG